MSIQKYYKLYNNDTFHLLCNKDAMANAITPCANMHLTLVTSPFKVLTEDSRDV